jgi:hypothetical protein
MFEKLAATLYEDAATAISLSDLRLHAAAALERERHLLLCFGEVTRTASGPQILLARTQLEVRVVQCCR